MPKVDVDRLREPAVWVLLVTAGVDTLLSFLGGIITGGGFTPGGVGPVTMAMAVGAVWLATKRGPELKNTQVIAYGALGTLAVAVLAILINIVRGLVSGGSPLAPGSGFYAVQGAVIGLLYLGIAVVAGLYVMHLAGIELPARSPKPAPAAGELPPGHGQVPMGPGAWQPGQAPGYGQPQQYQQPQEYPQQPQQYQQPQPYGQAQQYQQAQPYGGQETEAISPLDSFMREAPQAPEQQPAHEQPAAEQPTGDLLGGPTGAFPPPTPAGYAPGAFGVQQPARQPTQQPERPADDDAITGRPVPPAEMTVDLTGLGLQPSDDERPPDEWSGPERR